MKRVTMGRACGNCADMGAKRNEFRDLVEKKPGGKGTHRRTRHK
jgi:stalled ribosome alternative rescue factor ArfA